MKELSVRQLNTITENYPHDSKMQKDREISLIIARRSPALLQYASQSVLNDKSVAREAVKTDGRALRFFSEKIREDEEIVLLAVENFCPSFAFAVGKATKSLAVAKAVAKRGGETISRLDESFLKIKPLAISAIERNPLALGYFADEVRKDEQVVLLAILKDRTAVKFVHDDAFKNKAVFQKVVLDENGRVKSGFMDNFTPQGVFDEIERRGLKFNLSSQNLNLLTLDRDKLCVCLKLSVGAITKKADLLKNYILKEDREIISLLIERGEVTQKGIADAVKFASENRKVRVLPILLKQTGGVGLSDSSNKDARMYMMRSLRRKSPTAVARFKENYTEYLKDEEMVMLVASADGTVLKTLAKTDYVKNEKFVTECLKNYVVKISDGAILDGIEVDLSYEQTYLACKKDGRNYFFIKEEYKRSPQIAAVSVKSSEEVYASLPDELKTHPDVLKEKRIWST